MVSHTYRGGTAGFKYLDFGAARGRHTVLAELEARSTGCIQVYADAPHTGALLATLPIPATAVGAGWRTVQAQTAAVAGSHAVFLVFQPDHGQLGDLSFFGFRRNEEGAADEA